MATKKQSRAKVQGLVNPRGVTAVYGTPIDFKALPEKITIGRRVANGKFKLEAHYPAKQFNDKQTYIDKRKEGSYCRFYDKKSPFFVARTVWDATSQPGMHMIVKNRGETHRFIVTPKLDDPTKASVIGSYLVHRDNGDPVLCSGVIGELEAAGDDGDFKVTSYQNHGIRCPKFDSDKHELAGHIPKTFEYKKSTKPRGPRKTAADYCKPKHSFKHPTDIKKAEMIADMDDEMDDAVSCLKCSWDGSYEDLVFVDADGTGGGGYDFHLACPVCEEDEWLDDMMAEGYDEPCFSCDGVGHWDDGDCSYCHGSGLMSDTLRAEMSIYNSEYFDADCGCFKKAETFEAGGWETLPKTKPNLCVTCGEDMSAELLWGCQCCGMLVATHGDHEGCGEVVLPSVVVCKMCIEEGHEYPNPYEAPRKSIDEEGNLIIPKTEVLEDFFAHSTCKDLHKKAESSAPYQANVRRAIDFLEGAKEEMTSDKKHYTEVLIQYAKDCDLRGAETFEAPYAGAGALMGIKGDSALSSFTPSELTESSAIHGDFDQASLNYSGHQNIEVRAENRQPPWSATNPMPNRRWECGECDAKGVIAGEICTTCDGDGFWMIPSPRCATCDSDIEWTDGAECEGCEEWVCNDCLGEDYSCPKCKTTDLSFHAEGLGKDSCCCGATKSKPCACMKTGAKCSGSCACSTKEAEYNRPTPKWAKPLGLIGGLAAGYISAQMIDNAKE